MEFSHLPTNEAIQGKKIRQLVYKHADSWKRSASYGCWPKISPVEWEVVVVVSTQRRHWQERSSPRGRKWAHLQLLAWSAFTLFSTNTNHSLRLSIFIAHYINILWWLILCVILTGPQGTQISDLTLFWGVSVQVKRLAFESVNWVKKSILSNMGGCHPAHWGPE